MLLVLTIASHACQQKTPQVQPVMRTIDSLYALQLPGNLEPGYDMHDYASLQYYDVQSNLYVIGLEDAKENFGDIKRKQLKLSGYFDYLERNAFEMADSSFQETESRFLTRQGLEAKCGDYFVAAKPGEHPELFYRICVIESNNYFFQLVIWMPYASHCRDITIADQMVYSFRFLPPAEYASIGNN
ncbi:MAG: hypothetical protein AAF206_25700 [Bacteroidota bacterium]